MAEESSDAGESVVYDSDSDSNGGGSADEHELPPVPEDDDPVAYVYVEAPFNRDVAKRWSNKLAMRQLRNGSLSWADFLGGLPLRALPVAECQALKLPSGSWTRDRFKEPRIPVLLGLKGSLEPCADRRCEDERLWHERVGGHLRGLSVFAGPKLLRMLARCGVKAKIFDVVNSHLTHISRSLDVSARRLFLCYYFYSLSLSKKKDNRQQVKSITKGFHPPWHKKNSRRPTSPKVLS